DDSVPVTVGTNATVASPSDMTTAARTRKRQPMPRFSLTLFMTFPLVACSSFPPSDGNEQRAADVPAWREESRNGTLRGRSTLGCSSESCQRIALSIDPHVWVGRGRRDALGVDFVAMVHVRGA